jgi:hypothetical protein
MFVDFVNARRPRKNLNNILNLFHIKTESSSTVLGSGTRALFFVSRETGHCPEENPPNILAEF